MPDWSRNLAASPALQLIYVHMQLCCRTCGVTADTAGSQACRGSFCVAAAHCPNLSCGSASLEIWLCTSNNILRLSGKLCTSTCNFPCASSLHAVGRKRPRAGAWSLHTLRLRTLSHWPAPHTLDNANAALGRI